MGATVTRNGKEYYKADDGKLYQNYNAAVKALGPKPAAPATNNTKREAANSVAQQGQKQGPKSWLSNFNPVEAVASIALNNPVAATFRSGMRMVGDALGHGEKMDAMDNAVRAVTGNSESRGPSSYTGAGRTAIADGIDGAYTAGVKPNADGYVAVDYPHYNSTADGLIAGRIMGRKNSDGTYEISPGERYDFNASSVSEDERAAYKKNLDGAMQSAANDGSVLRMLANAPDYLNYYTGAGRTAIADGIDGAYTAGVKPNADGYVAVDYPHYNSTADGLIAGRIMGRKNSDGSYEVAPGERYDFNASSVSEDERAAYKKNLDGAMQSAYDDGSVLRMLANAPDYLNYYTGAGGKGMNIGGKFSRPGTEAPTTQQPTVAPQVQTQPTAAPTPGSYAIQAGDTLSAIARQRGVSVDEIANINNISNVDQIAVGQQLRFK